MGEATAAHTHPVPEPGCYAPAVTLFDPDTDRLDLEAQSKYFAYLASTGLKGLVVLGTNAETLLLTREERRALLETARASVPPGFPIIAGVSGHSTAQVLEYAADARAAGADFLLILPCAYFGRQTTGRVVEDFFDQVATAVAPAPIVLYNFPAVCAGVDMDADTIIRITERNPNVVGVKLTCANVSKVVRLAAKFPPHRFAAFGGQSDFLVGTLASGGAGCIAAFGNVFPRSIARLFDLWRAGAHAEALRLQQDLALAESAIKAGVAGTKWAAAAYTAPRAGIGPPERARRLFQPRRPYSELGAEGRARVEEVMGPIRSYEDVKAA